MPTWRTNGSCKMRSNRWTSEHASLHDPPLDTHKLEGLILEVAIKAPQPFPPLGSGLTLTPMLFNTVVHSPTTGNKYPG